MQTFRYIVLVFFLCGTLLSGCADWKIEPYDLILEPIDLIRVEGGTFQMGNANVPSEAPVHSVTVNGFYLGQFEVTVEQFGRFIAATNYQTDADKDGGSLIFPTREKRPGVNWAYNYVGARRTDNENTHPVVHVSWNDAVAYCNWLSTVNNKRYRLPTEAEWEFAARGGTSNQNYYYSGGNSADEVAWYGANSASVGTRPVGGKKANELGLHDMNGNVWEWCSDYFAANYYTTGAVTNPTGPSSGTTRMLRGGSYGDTPENVRVSIRIGETPNGRFFNAGFRVLQEE